ncbi:MAG: DUF58 domain-containing protein [Opitutales bacterium]
MKDILNEDIKAKLEAIKITSIKLISDYLGGQLRSTFKGSGLEFNESREYVASDDVRYIDWKITAKTGKTYVKTFIEEREKAVMILSDVSASGSFAYGQKSKFDIIAEISAMLSFIAMRHSERIGVAMFSDKMEDFMPPSHAKTHLMGFLHRLFSFDNTDKKTDIKGAIHYFLDVMKKRSVVFLVSDFLDSSYEDNIRELARKHDLVAIRVFSPSEVELPKGALISLRDAETGAEFLIDTSSKKVLEAYKAKTKAIREKFETKMKHSGIDYLDIDISKDYKMDLVKFLKERQERYATSS